MVVSEKNKRARGGDEIISQCSCQRLPWDSSRILAGARCCLVSRQGVQGENKSKGKPDVYVYLCIYILYVYSYTRPFFWKCLPF